MGVRSVVVGWAQLTGVCAAGLPKGVQMRPEISPEMAGKTLDMALRFGF